MCVCECALCTRNSGAMFSYRPFITETICSIAGKQIRKHTRRVQTVAQLHGAHDGNCSMYRWCRRWCSLEPCYVVSGRWYPCCYCCTMGDEGIYARAFNICFVSLCVCACSAKVVVKAIAIALLNVDTFNKYIQTSGGDMKIKMSGNMYAMQQTQRLRVEWTLCVPFAHRVFVDRPPIAFALRKCFAYTTNIRYPFPARECHANHSAQKPAEEKLESNKFPAEK